MKRTTVMLDDDLVAEMRYLARLERRPVAALIRDALRLHLEKHASPRRRLSFTGIGASSEPLDHERIDDILRAGLDPREGWSPRRGEPEGVDLEVKRKEAS